MFPLLHVSPRVFSLLSFAFLFKWYWFFSNISLSLAVCSCLCWPVFMGIPKDTGSALPLGKQTQACCQSGMPRSPLEAVPATRSLSIARAYIHHFILGQTYLGWATHIWFPNWSIWGLPSWCLLILPLAAPQPHYLSSSQLWGRYLSSLVSLSVWLLLLYDSEVS